MNSYAEFVIKFRAAIIVVVLGITAWMGFQATTLTVNSDILSYLPQDKQSVITFNEVGSIFGGSSMAVIALESPEGNVFTAPTLKTIRKLTTEFEKIEGIRSVMSLSNILDIKQIEDGLEIGKLIHPTHLPDTAEALDALKKYTLSKEMYAGSLVSLDGRYTMIMARLEEGAKKDQVGEILRDKTEQLKGTLTPYYAGLPLWMIFISDLIFADMGLLIPLVAILVMATLFVSFRSARGVILPLTTVAFSTVWSLGLMAIWGVELTMVSNAMPVLLIAIGSAYGIHMINKYNEVIRLDLPVEECLKRAITEVGLPIILAGITTLAGFLSFTTSYLTLIQEFGVFTAIGVFIALLLSTTFLPATLSYLPRPKIRRGQAAHEANTETKLMLAVASIVTTHPRFLLVAALSVIIISTIGAGQIIRSVSMIEYFKENSEIRTAEKMMEEEFGGAMVIQVRVQGGIKDPFVLKEMLRIGKYLNTLPHVSNAQSAANLVAELNMQMNGYYSIPDSATKVGNLWMLIEGNEIMEQLISNNEQDAVIQATIGISDAEAVVALVDTVADFLKEEVTSQWEVVSLMDKQADSDCSTDCRTQLVNKVVEMVRYDLAGPLQNKPAQLTEIEQIIRSNAFIPVALGDNNNLNGSMTTLSDYLQSDESELEIESSETLLKLQNGIHKLLSEDQFSLQNLETVITQSIPADITEDDPELAVDLANSLLMLMDERKKALGFKQLLSKIKMALPENLRTDAWIINDLTGDLWSLNDNYISIPENTAGVEKKVLYEVTGMPVVYKELDQSLVMSQALSLIYALLIVFVLVSLQFKSLWAGTIAAAPIVYTVSFNFGMMGYLSVPLDMSTMMIASIAVGIGVDYAIHFLSRMKLACQQGQSIDEAIHTTISTTGMAIVINAVAVAAGFAVLVFGSLVPMFNFGWMTAITMLVSAASALLLIPTILLVTKRGKFLYKS